MTEKKRKTTKTKAEASNKRVRAKNGRRRCTDCETDLGKEQFSPGKRICRPCQATRSAISLAKRHGPGELDMTAWLDELESRAAELENDVSPFDSHEALSAWVKQKYSAALENMDATVDRAKQYLEDATRSKNPKRIDEAAKRFAKALDINANLLSSLSDRLDLMHSLKIQETRAPAVTFHVIEAGDLDEMLRRSRESGN